VLGGIGLAWRFRFATAVMRYSELYGFQLVKSMERAMDRRAFLKAAVSAGATATHELERRTMDRVTWRLLPFLIVCYFIAVLDRVNVGFANATMSEDLGLSAAAFGGAAGIFFIGYFFVEVPSNLALSKFGARVWIARIMFTWGIISGAQAFVVGEASLNIVRLLLGVAEAGFLPGIIFFLTLWFPAAYRGRALGLFLLPVSTVIGSPISGFILDMEGVGGLHGWQWMFLIQALPALLMAFAVLYYLTDRPGLAAWLEPDERKWLQDRLDAERANRETFFKMGWLKSMVAPRVLALGILWFFALTPQWGLNFFLPQIVKDFGLTNVQAGFVTTIPYVIGTIGMVHWGRHSDRNRERKWHVVISFIALAVGLGFASITANPIIKLVAICVASWGLWSIPPVFYTLPTAFLSGAGAAAGIAAINSIGALGGYFGPKVFGQLRDWTGTDFAGLIFLSSCAVIGAMMMLVLGHNPALERPAHTAPVAA
jgi:MFS transporter, ACS family, tartrate transporter